MYPSSQMSDHAIVNARIAQAQRERERRWPRSIVVLYYDQNGNLKRRGIVVIKPGSTVKSRIMKRLKLRGDEKNYLLQTKSGKPVTDDQVIARRTYRLCRLPPEAAPYCR